MSTDTNQNAELKRILLIERRPENGGPFIFRLGRSTSVDLVPPAIHWLDPSHCDPGVEADMNDLAAIRQNADAIYEVDTLSGHENPVKLK